MDGKIMKKIFCTVIIGVFLLSGLGSNLSIIDEAAANIMQTYTFSIKIPDSFSVRKDENNNDIVLMDGFHYIIDSGKPLLPSRNFLIALPLGGRVESVEITGQNLQQQPNTYQIKPAPAPMPLIEPRFFSDFMNTINAEWKNNYESVYSLDNPFPNTPGKLVCKGTFHHYPYVAVVLYPFVYHPSSGRLFKYNSATIKIHYITQKTQDIQYDKEVDEKASDLFENYDEIRKFYPISEITTSSSSESFDYVVITTDNLYNVIASSHFLEWKSSIGYHPKVLNVTDELISEQPGHDLAEKIRTFLREYYNDWGIKYVLIVGNYDTVPMRYCFFNRNNHNIYHDIENFWRTGEVPTDYYYADLSYPDEASWDSDGDGFYGEYLDDNPDFLAEVYVGRIPTNDAVRAMCALEKSITFESDTGDWKQNVLHAGAIIDFRRFKDGAHTLNHIEHNVMTGMVISHYSEQQGVKTSDYPWSSLTEESFTNDWKTGCYGIVNWFAHGWCDSASRYIWEHDEDDDGKADSNELVWKDMINIESDLDDDYPSIIFDMSCLVGYPEPCPDEWPEEYKGNLGVDLLTKPSFGASVGIICETRFGYIGAVDYPDNQGGIESMCYEFNKNLVISNESIGEAFYDAKFYCNQNCPISDNREYANMEGYNLYGDPSLLLEGDIGKGRPEKPILSGPTSGKMGEEYYYSTSSIDPDDDDIFYLFEWGDKTNSGWLGPFYSGEVCNVSHIWNHRGDYQIRVRVKDVKGVVGEWSDPLSVTMPKSKLYSDRSFLRFMQNILDKFPLFAQLLQFLIFDR